MRIWKPLEGKYKPRDVQQDHPCWFFEGVEIPDFDYDNLNWNNIQGELLTFDDIYKKRDTAHSYKNEDSEIMKWMKKTIKNIIKEIRDEHPIKGLHLSWPIDTWSSKDLNDEWDIRIDLKRDNIGFTMRPHLDNRNTKWTFIMNLRDNKEMTRFHIAEALGGDVNDTIVGPNTKGSGVFYFNHRELLHSIGPITEDGRLTVFFMKMIF